MTLAAALSPEYVLLGFLNQRPAQRRAEVGIHLIERGERIAADHQPRLNRRVHFFRIR
jgi:hypothetical protein